MAEVRHELIDDLVERVVSLSEKRIDGILKQFQPGMKRPLNVQVLRVLEDSGIPQEIIDEALETVKNIKLAPGRPRKEQE